MAVPVGGSFMFVIPAFLFLGLDGAATLLLARIFMLAAMATSSGYFFLRTRFDWREVLPFVAGNLVGYFAAAQLVATLDLALLTKIVPWVLVVGGVVLLKKYTLQKVHHRRLVARLLPVFGMALGFYAGFGGGGNGQIIALIFALAFGWQMSRALVNTRLVELFGNAVAVAVYLGAGFMPTGHEFAVFCGGAVGGLLGARLTLHAKPAWLAYAFLALALASAVKISFF